MREHVQYKVKTDVKEERRKEGNLPDIELHQLHGHALAETFHGELRGSVNIIEHHSCTDNGGKKGYQCFVLSKSSFTADMSQA